MKPQKVTFVCLHGSAKSLIAAEYFNRLAAEKKVPLRASNAGPEPDAVVADNVVDGFKARGIDVSGFTPRKIAADQLTDTDLIVSFACDAGSKLAPGRPEERWDDCPTVADDFDIAWGYITTRVEKLIARLAAG